MKPRSILGAALSLSPVLLLGIPFLLMRGCSHPLPVSRQDVIGTYHFERGPEERTQESCLTINDDNTYRADGLHAKEPDIPASGTWRLDGEGDAFTISVGLHTSISKDKSGTVTIKLPEAENGFDCVKRP
jgi:hypothetical protein